MVSSTVYAWGAGEDGQLGLGDLAEQHLLQPIRTLQGLDIVSLVGGSRNSLALTSDGKLYTWGWNQRGTLGHPQEAKVESIPRQVAALAGVKIVQAAIGGWHCLAVDDQGQAYAWGGNEYGQCGHPVEKNLAGKIVLRDISIPEPCAPHLRVKQVAAGGTHSMVLTTDGEVWTWGQPWPPGDSTNIWVPVKVQGLSKVKQIAVGAFHNLALLSDGKVVAWGNNEYAQLGVGDTQPRATPEVVDELTGKDVVDVSAGGWHSFAITSRGEVYSWGRGEHGRLGFGDDKSTKMTPHKVELLADEKIVQVGCGGTHSVVLTDDGRAFVFGRGDHGRLGLGHKLTSGHPTEIHLAHLDEDNARADPGRAKRWRIEQIACGGRHNLACLSFVETDSPRRPPAVLIHEPSPTSMDANPKPKIRVSSDLAVRQDLDLGFSHPEISKAQTSTGVAAPGRGDDVDMSYSALTSSYLPEDGQGGTEECGGGTGGDDGCLAASSEAEEIIVLATDHAKGEKHEVRFESLDGKTEQGGRDESVVDGVISGKVGG